MYGICGWLGKVSTAEESSRLLATMLRDCGARPLGGRVPCVLSGPLYVAVFGGADSGDQECLFANERLVVAVSDGARAPSGKSLSAAELADRYVSHGEGFLKRVRGPFAVALYDNHRGKLVLAIDRAGIRPLYVRRVGDTIGFATRLAALRRIPGPAVEVSRQSLFDYLFFHQVPSPSTIYADCEKLLPAQMLSLAGTESSTRFYWRMPYRDENPTALETLRREFRDLFPKVVLRAAGDLEAVGSLLHGDTATSAVAGTLRGSRDLPIRTYFADVGTHGCDASEQARIAARHFETTARARTIEPQELGDSLHMLAGYCDEPIGNACLVPTYLCARFARVDGTQRLLGGHGGTEIFGDDARYAEQLGLELYNRLPQVLRKGLIEPLALGLPGGNKVPLLRTFRHYVSRAITPLPDRLERDNPLYRAALGDIFDPDFLAGVDIRSPLAGLREVYARAGSEAVLNRLTHLDLKFRLADSELRMVNQACEFAGVDVRFPLLDDEMLEFAARIPPPVRAPRAHPGYFFKKSLDDFLPQEILGNTGHRVALPGALWLAASPPLRDLAQESLTGLGQRGILNPAYVEGLLQRHQRKGASDAGTMLWVLIMLEQWLRQHGH